MSETNIVSQGLITLLKNKILEINSMKSFEYFFTDQLFGLTTSEQKRFMKWVKNNELFVYEGWPQIDKPKLPAFCILQMSGGENPGTYSCGDRLELPEYEVIQTDAAGNGYRIDRIDYYGVDSDALIDIEVWSLNGELTPHLHSLAKQIIFRNKDFFADYGVYNIDISEGIFAPNQEIFPNIPFVKSLNCKFQGEFKETRRTYNAPIKQQTNFLSGTFSN